MSRIASLAAIIACLAALAACSDPTLNAGLRISPDGVRVVPSLSGRVGGVGVAVTP
jgi:hypothetical protein